MKLAGALFLVTVTLLAACVAFLWRGELPPTWLAIATCAAVLALAVLALITAWRQS